MTTVKRCGVAAAALALAAFAAGAAHAGKGIPHDHVLTVETRNLFIGFDAGELLATFDTTGAWADVHASDPAGRAEEWANEIAAARPHLVGLQEAALYETGPLFNPLPATTVEFDFIDLLLDALAAKGLTYVQVATFEGTEVEFPTFFPFFEDVRFTDRVAILARADAAGGLLKLSGPQTGAYAVNLVVPGTPIGDVTVERGWAAVDAKWRGKSFRFVTTHLEAFAEVIRFAQAAQLLAGPAAGPQPTVLLGDFNSDANDPPLAAPTYWSLVGAGFTDVWAAVFPGVPGLTCCHDDLTTAIPYDERLDLVLVKGGITALDGDVIGDVAGASFPFFPSDHAGVVAKVQLPLN